MRSLDLLKKYYSKCPDALGHLRVELLYLIVGAASILVLSNSTKAIGVK